MKIIRVNGKDLDSLPRLSTGELNSEANICIFKKSILKIFKNDYVLQRKENVVDFFDENRIELNYYLHELLLPKYKVVSEDGFIGYGMKYVNGESLDSYFSREDIPAYKKINILIKIGEFINRLEELRLSDSKYINLFINDLHAENIMVVGNDIKFIDVDSFAFNNDKSFPALYLSVLSRSYLDGLKKFRFDRNDIVANRESDLYCYIMMVTQLLTGINLSGRSATSINYYLSCFKDMGINDEFIECVRSIFECEPTKNPVYSLMKIDRLYNK